MHVKKMKRDTEKPIREEERGNRENDSAYVVTIYWRYCLEITAFVTDS